MTRSNWSNNEIGVKPEVMLLEQVLDEIGRGRLRVPRFQRPFVWRPSQMTDLFDSIERGYPIGSVLIWESPRDLPSLDSVAGIDIAPAPESSVSYILDGQQRLSTLFGSLRKRFSAAGYTGQDKWMWDIYRVLGREGDQNSNKYRHWKSPQPPPKHYLPMRSVLRTIDFLSFARELTLAGLNDVNSLIEEAEEVASRIKSYKMAVIRLVGGDIEHAVDVFSRLNSSGQNVTPDQMVSALTYRPSNSATLADRIEEIQESLASEGYSQIPPITIFRSVLAVAGEDDVQEASWGVLAQRVKGSLESSVETTRIALHRVVDFLNVDVGVPLARLVPYNAQIFLLATAFRNSELSGEQRNELVKWFWATSWSGYFAGANTTQIKNAIQAMRSFSDGMRDLEIDGQSARPFPSRFDSRSARVRAFLIWEISTFRHRLDCAERPIDVVGILAQSDIRAYRHVFSSGTDVSSPANRMLLPTPSGTSIRSSLLSLSMDSASRVLESHGVPSGCLDALVNGDAQRFVSMRASYLSGLEREFMDHFGIQTSNSQFGEADIDAE